MEHRQESKGDNIVIIPDFNRQTILMKYPPRPLARHLSKEVELIEHVFGISLSETDFSCERVEIELWDVDFPNRNMIPVHEQTNGKWKIVDWIEGIEPTPGPSMRRFLKSGEKTYVPTKQDKQKVGVDAVDALSRFSFTSSRSDLARADGAV